MAAIEEAFGVALLEEGPDGVIVLVGEGEVAAAVIEGAELADDFAGSRGHFEAAGELGGKHAVTIGEGIAEGEEQLGVIPIAPVSQADGLLGLAGCKGEHALLAGAYEILDAEIADVALGAEPQALFHLDFDP